MSAGSPSRTAIWSHGSIKVVGQKHTMNIFRYHHWATSQPLHQDSLSKHYGISKLSESKKLMLFVYLYQFEYNFPALEKNKCEPFQWECSGTSLQSHQPHLDILSFRGSQHLPTLPCSNPYLLQTPKGSANLSVPLNFSHSCSTFTIFIVICRPLALYLIFSLDQFIFNFSHTLSNNIHALMKKCAFLLIYLKTKSLK